MKERPLIDGRGMSMMMMILMVGGDPAFVYQLNFTRAVVVDGLSFVHDAVLLVARMVVRHHRSSSC